MWTDDLARAMEKIQRHYGKLCCMEHIDNNRIVMSGGDVWIMENGDVHLAKESTAARTYELDVAIVGKLIIDAHSIDEARAAYDKLSWADLTRDMIEINDCVRDVRAID